MKKVRILFLACLLIFSLAFTACTKADSTPGDGQGTENATPTEAVTDTPAPTEEVKPTEEVTATPTAEPTATEAPTDTPTEEPTPEITEEPTPEVTAAAKYADEDVEYEKPELLVMGVAHNMNSEWLEGKKLYEVSIDNLVLGNEEREKYPNLALVIDVLDLNTSDAIEEAVETYKGYVEDGNVLPDAYYFQRGYYDILRADSNVVSIIGTEAVYTGGVHPEYGRVGYSIDVKTGEVLGIKDICNDLDSLGTMIAYRLNEKYGLWEEDDKLDELVTYLDGIIEDGSIYFSVGYEGVTFYFVPYEIATYADGNLEVTLSFEEAFVADEGDGPRMVGLFKKRFRTVPENYMISLSVGEEVELLDIDGETGSFGTFTLCGTPNEMWEDAYEGFYMLINGEEVFRSDEIYFDSPNAYLAVIGERRFVILVTNQSSDDTYTYMFEIKNGEIIGDIDNYSGMDLEYLRTYYGDGKWDYNVSSKTVYDPENIRCSFRHDVIGTNFLSGTFRIDTENLSFEPTSKYYDFSSNHTLTLKKEFKAGMIDPELMFNGDESVTGEMDMEVELKAGDTIHLEKATDDYQVFFSAENGEWGTFKMDTPESYDEYYYSDTIGGENINDLFDGISYAD